MAELDLGTTRRCCVILDEPGAADSAGEIVAL